MLRFVKYFKDQSCSHIDRPELLTGPFVAPLVYFALICHKALKFGVLGDNDVLNRF